MESKSWMTIYKIRLYVAGDSELSRRAVENMEGLCDSLLKGRCEHVVIDVLEDIASARNDRVIATPMAVRYDPLPVRKAIGDLSDVERLLNGLGIPKEAAENAEDGCPEQDDSGDASGTTDCEGEI